MAYGKKRGKKMPKGEYDKKKNEKKAKAGGTGKATGGGMEPITLGLLAGGAAKPKKSAPAPSSSLKAKKR